MKSKLCPHCGEELEKEEDIGKNWYYCECGFKAFAKTNQAKLNVVHSIVNCSLFIEHNLKYCSHLA